MNRLRSDVFQDWNVNHGRRKSQVVLALFRLAAACHRGDGLPGPFGRLYVGGYKVLTNWFMGVELPPEVVAGPQLRLFHPHAIVLHPDVRLGARCTLRQCSTLGNIDQPDGPTDAPVVGDDVEFGAGVLVLGPRQIGDRARVGAGSVVVHDVPADTTVVGNPARPLPARAPS